MDVHLMIQQHKGKKKIPITYIQFKLKNSLEQDDTYEVFN